VTIYHYTWSLFKKFPLRFVLIVILISVVGLVEMVSVFSMAPVIDLLIHPDLDNLSSVTQKVVKYMKIAGITPTTVHFLIAFMVIRLSYSFLMIISNYSIVRLDTIIYKDLALDMYKSFFNARWYFFSSTRQGTLLNAFNRELANVGSSFKLIGEIVLGIVRVAFYIIIPICISWQITFIAVGIGVFFAIPLLFLSKLNYKYGEIRTSCNNRIMNVIQESLGGVKVILGYGNQHKHIEKLDQAFSAHRRVTVKTHALEIITTNIYEPVAWLVLAFILYFSIQNFIIPITEIALIAYALMRIVSIIGYLISRKNALHNLQPSYRQINNIMSKAKENVQHSGERIFKKLVNSVVLRGVTFAYPNHRPVLKDINAVIRKGKMTAFVGESGVGKSTLIDLLVGFYDQCDGAIEIDDIPLSEYNIISFRERIGFVPQDSILFNDTIHNNLLWSYDKALKKEVVEACQISNAHDFIMKMPNGYDTVVGDRGVRLSGGQRQRIALARALLRKPELLILDEATSSLDSQSETLVQQAIEEIAHQTTIVIIAHRLSTIAKADWIYVLDHGCIVEQGTYRELIDRNGSFGQMAMMQNKGIA
jgi:ABC-type multidrug transport system fused ATPase/permease subunit